MQVASASQERKCPIAENSRNYNGIDLIKFLCAIMVFTIHISPFQDTSFGAAQKLNSFFQGYLCRLAVPFFFVSSGFFLFRKMELSHLKTDVIRDYCFKIFRMIGIWSVLLVVGGTFHLWYMGATVVAMLLLNLCLRLGIRIRFVCVLAVVLYCVGLLGDSYYGLIAPLENIAVFRYGIKGYAFFFESTRNGLFMAFIFVLMGALLAHSDTKMRPKTAMAGFAASMICLLAEYLLLELYSEPKDHNMYVCLLPAVYFLFSMACSMNLKDRVIYRRLRNIGVLVYFLHIMVNKIVKLGISVVEKYLGTGCGAYEFLISLLLTFAVAVVIEWMSHKEKFRWLRWIY